MSKPIIQLKDVNKFYGENHVIKDLNLEVDEGEFFTMLGSSGCGKTTTLRMIAGFERPTSGLLAIDGQDMADKEPNHRDVNTVFQSYALFPHMTIFDNVAYGLRMKRVPKPEIRERVTEMLDLVQLGGFENRKPDQLSGGQKQRVAIARALINRPRVLLLDEPLGALDLKLRKQMQIELKRLQRKLGITFVYVTHDQEEALSMSDRIAIMNDGVLEQVGTPTEIYEEPATRFVATFIGETNLFEGVVDKVGDGMASVGVETGTIEVATRDAKAGEMLAISVRPERMRISPAPTPGFALPGVVRDQVYIGSAVKVIVELPNGQEVRVERLAGDEPVRPGVAYLSWDPADARIVRSRDQVVLDAVENAELIAG